ncbi:MAG: hypothetical protein Q4P08_02380 [Eubacteriales bacterium]|nr:hypothetical protein [Eubacteriales bacterium]
MKDFLTSSHRFCKQSLKSLLALLLFSLILLGSWQVPAALKAQDELYFYFPPQINQGELFYVTISLQKQETIDTVQLFLAYDPSAFTYSPENSFLIQPGLEMNDGHNIFNDIRSASEASLALIHWQGEKLSDANGTVAQLAFIANSDAPLASSVISLVYSANNVAPFVSTVESGKIVESEGFTMKVDLLAPEIPEPQAEPIPPVIKETGSADPNLPAGQGEAAQPGDQGDLENPAQGSDNPAVETPPAQVVVQRTEQTEANAESKSPLLDIDGNELFVPSLSPPESQIPQGFSLEKMTLHGLEIPAIHSGEKVVTLYYLRRDNQASFYSYKPETDRFSPEDIDKYLIREQKNEQKSFDRDQDKNFFSSYLTIILLSLVIIGSLGLLIGIGLRQFRR